MKEIVRKICLGLLFIYLCGYKSVIVIGEVFTLGYLTGSQRRAGNLEYQKPGTCVTIILFRQLCWRFAIVENYLCVEKRYFPPKYDFL